MNIQRITFWANQNSIDLLCIFEQIQTANEIESKISSRGLNLIKIQNQVSEFSLHIQATLTASNEIAHCTEIIVDSCLVLKRQTNFCLYAY